MPENEDIIQPIQQGSDEPESKYIVPLDGKWMPSQDPALIGKNFSTLTNMRYADGHPESVKGMTKVNTTVMDNTYLKARSTYHFKKSQPDETHVLVQAFNSGETASQVLENRTAIGSTGNFDATELWTDSDNADIAQFSDAPNGQVAYCNGVDSCIWGGYEMRCAAFINFDPGGTFAYDLTERVDNTNTSTDNLASFSSVSGGIDADCTLMLHLDNNVTDSSTNASTVNNTNVTFSTTEKVFGTHGAVFDGTAYLEIEV